MPDNTFNIIISSAPYSNSHFKEGLDIVLAASAFDRPTNLILEDEACYALIKTQDPKQIDQKNILQVMKALPIYGVDHVLVCKESYSQLNIDTHDLPIPIKLLTLAEKNSIIRNSGTVIRF